MWDQTLAEKQMLS